MFEFSSPAGKSGGFRSVMAERVSRLFEARTSKSPVSSASPVASEVASPVASRVVSSALSSKLRPAGVRCVSVKNPKTLLKSMAPNIKRAASASVFQRIAERLAKIQSQFASQSSSQSSSVFASGPVGLKVPSVRPSMRLRQSPVASRYH